MQQRTLPSRSPAHTHCRSRVARLTGLCRAQQLPAGFTDMHTSILAGPQLLLSPAERVRLDERPDHLFYSTPRLMQHESPAFLTATTELLAATLPPAGRLLDLCASWDSHLPPPAEGGKEGGGSSWEVVGVGLNSQELGANQALSSWVVQDLNTSPHLQQLEGASFDAALLVNGAGYLTQLEVVVAEVWRVLKAGGVLVVVFGDYCFAEKALAGWLSRDMQGRGRLLSRVLSSCGFAVEVSTTQPAVATTHSSSTVSTNTTSSSSDGATNPTTTSSSDQDAAAPAWCAVVGRKPARGQQQGAGAGGAGWGAGSQLQGGLRPGMEPAAAAAAMLARYPHLTDLAQHVEGAGEAPPSSSSSSSGGSGSSGSSEGGGDVAGEVAVGQGPATMNPQQQQQQQQQQEREEEPEDTAGAAAAPALAITTTSSSTSGQPGADGRAVPALPAAAGGREPSGAVLERWRGAYLALCGDAADLGIPVSVLPCVPAQASAAELQEATQHLQDMIASFLSSGL